MMRIANSSSRWSLVLLSAATVLSWGCSRLHKQKPVTAASATEEGAQFDGAALVRPTSYREWQYVSTGVGMSYAPAVGRESMFDNVFVQRSAYESFKQHGVWPEKTMFVLELRASSNHGSILKQGTYQTGAILVEAAVKDSARYPKSWAYFSFYPGAGGALPAKVEPNPDAACLSCHQAHAWVDSTFAQFYPTLLPVAEKLGTVVNRPAGAP